VSNICSCGLLAYSDNERVKQLFYTLDDHVWGMKITILEESADFATLDTEKMFSKLKSHELSRKYRLNHDASLSSKTLIISARVGGHDANPTNNVSSAFEFVLSSLVVTSNEQYESIPDNEIALLVRKFRVLHRFCKQGRRSPRAASSAATSPTLSPTVLIGRRTTPPISTTTPIEMTPATRATTRRSIASEIRRIRRSSRKSCPEHVLS
jgi:hypothetical protein